MNKHSHKWFNEMAVVAVFFLVVAAGLFYALFHLEIGPAAPTVNQPLAISSAPTVSAYEHEADTVLAPFLEQAAKVGQAELASGDQDLLDLIGKTQDRLLRMIVPAERKDAHLKFVLLLEQWRRALNGSAADQKQVLASTQQVLADNPWLR